MSVAQFELLQYSLQKRHFVDLTPLRCSDGNGDDGEEAAGQFCRNTYANASSGNCDFIWCRRGGIRTIKAIQDPFSLNGHPLMSMGIWVYCAGELQGADGIRFKSGHFKPTPTHALYFMFDMIEKSIAGLAPLAADSMVERLFTWRLEICRSRTGTDTFEATTVLRLAQEILGTTIYQQVLRGEDAAPTVSVPSVSSSSSSSSSSSMTHIGTGLSFGDQAKAYKARLIADAAAASAARAPMLPTPPSPPPPVRIPETVVHRVIPRAEPQRWVVDAERDQCQLCRKGFSVLRRRHHCRECGDVFCATCTAYTRLVTHPANPQGRRAPMGAVAIEHRVCKICKSSARIESGNEPRLKGTIPA